MRFVCRVCRRVKGWVCVPAGLARVGEAAREADGPEPSLDAFRTAIVSQNQVSEPLPSPKLSS